MTSTVPGAITGKSLVQAAAGAQAPDLTGLSAKTIQLTPDAPLRSVAGRPSSVDSFGAALARAIAAKKAASASNASAASRQAAARQGSSRAEHAAARDSGDVREVTRQLKQLVGAVREALGPRNASGPAGPAAPRAQLATNGQNVIQQQDQAALSPADAEALRGVFARVVGMNADRQGGSEDRVQLSAQQEAGAEALLQTVADALAQAMGGDGEIDEGTLASALESDPLALAAAESLIAAAQAQGLIPVTVPVALVEGTAEIEGAQEGDGAVPAAQPGASAPAITADAASASAPTGTTGAADGAGATGGTPIDLVATSAAATSAATAGTADAAAAVTVELTGTANASGLTAQAAVAPTADGGASPNAPFGVDVSSSDASLLDTQSAAPAAPSGTAGQAVTATSSAESLIASASAAETLTGAAVAAVDTPGTIAPEAATKQDQDPQTPALTASFDPAAALGAAGAGAPDAAAEAAAAAVLSVVAEAEADAVPSLTSRPGDTAGTPDPSSTAPAAAAQGAALAQAASAMADADGAASMSDASDSGGDDTVSSVAGTSPVPAQAESGEAGSITGQPASAAQTGQSSQTSQGAQGGQAGETAGSSQPIAQSGPAGAAPRAAGAQVAQAAGEAGEVQAYDLHDQVAPVIVRQARLVTVGGSQELTVRLNPDHLGPLHVRISLAEGALTVGLTAANAEAHRALENALPQLRGALVDAGLRLDRVDVAFRDAGNPGGSGQRGGFTGRGSDGQPGSQDGDAGRFARQFGAGTGGAGGSQDDAPSFADVLFDQDGRAFPVRRADSALANAGYRAYGAAGARRRY